MREFILFWFEVFRTVGTKEFWLFKPGPFPEIFIYDGKSVAETWQKRGNETLQHPE